LPPVTATGASAVPLKVTVTSVVSVAVPVITRSRQARGIRRALTEVDAFADALREGVPAEIAATHLRSAETALEEVLGVITGDQVLDRVFREFCIGK